MTWKEPTVSIGIPVYNGENYLGEALNSVFAQTFTDFEIIISDNASQDRTESVCRCYAEKDSRIRYYRQPSNLGLFKNYDIVFELSSGKYFHWLAHDDTIAPEFLAKTVAVLEQDPSLIICYTQEYKTDKDGTITETIIFPSRLDSHSLKERIHDALFVPPISVSGLIRSDALKKTRMNLEFIGSDWNLAVELALMGRFYQIPEPLYLRRSHALSSLKLFTKHERMSFSKPAIAHQIFFPTWRQTYEYFRSIHMYVSSFKNRMICYGELLKWIFYPRTIIDLYKDLKMAAKKLLRRSTVGEKIYHLYQKIFHTIEAKN